MEELGVHLTSKSTFCFHAGFLEELFSHLRMCRGL